jgi:hypothetical protein
MYFVEICPTILSTANAKYDTLKYLEEEDIVMDYSDNMLLDKIGKKTKKSKN